MSSSLKPAATIDEHIIRLQSRGMKIDKALAEQWFSHVSYYRLSAYWYPARQFNEDGTSRSSHFVDGTDFVHVISLYEADRKLRTLIHDGMERIEVAMRTKLVELLCTRHPNDPTFYLRSDDFRPNFDHVSWLSTAYGRLARAKKNDAVKHYIDEYGGQYPMWVVAEVLDFSDISKLYAGLGSNDQRSISEALDIKIDFASLNRNQKQKLTKKHPLASWLEQLTIIRNTCAHHGRLWNRSFAPAPTEVIRSNGSLYLLPEIQSEKLFGALIVMAHMLRTVSPGTTWPDKIVASLNQHFLTNPLVEKASIGIQSDWDEKTL
ncbi:Abi family protein [uncultured Corynebacterium sp.]|uniref:Abi family protein n=1 Tax=uncultured Corynebacterium sp. TaxID=159447 RepID=UPI0025D062AF|nr:Abi family protein [uncultured Corynebacterium sp.]